MTDIKEKQSDKNSGSEQYSAGYGDELVGLFKGRTVSKEASFFVPYLNPGMTLLDCGSGPGTISVGLAKVIAPGRVIGIDMEISQVEAAQAHALECGVSNVQFEPANVYELPFSDASFDAAFVHCVLQHLKNPLNALREIYRILKPGGIIGVRDDDRGALLIAPPCPQMEKLIALLGKHMEYCGGNPYVGRHHRKLLRQAGFIRTKASASCGYHGTLEETRKCVSLGAHLAGTTMAETAIRMDWVSPDELKELIAASIEWGENPDAFESIIMCEAVGWKE